MRLHCFDCLQQGKKTEAEFIVFLDSPDQMRPVCVGHFDDYERSYGEENIKFFTLGDVEQAIIEANKLLAYWDGKYSRLLQEYSKLKKATSESSKNVEKETQRK